MSVSGRNTGRRAALFVSPHLDDVAFSCGGTLAKLAREEWSVTLATVFTRSVADPRGFALECQLDKGLPPEVDYMDTRRAEDREFARSIGGPQRKAVEVAHLDHAEAPHRGYESAPSLFGGVREGDEVFRGISDDLASLLASVSPDIVFVPQGLGGHVDHLQTIEAVREVFLGRDGSINPPGAHRTPRLFWFRDAPYAIRAEASGRPDFLPDTVEETSFPLSGNDLERKLRACGAYATQLGFQFGGTGGIRESLTAFATKEARRVGLMEGDIAEVFLTNSHAWPAKPAKGTA